MRHKTSIGLRNKQKKHNLTRNENMHGNFRYEAKTGPRSLCARGPAVTRILKPRACPPHRRIVWRGLTG